MIFCGFCMYGFVIQGVFLSLMKWVRPLWLWYYEEEFGSWWGLWKLGLSELGKKSDDDDDGVLKFFFVGDEICIWIL